MSESHENSTPQDEQTPVVYAPPMKRVWAWVGVVYMVIITLLVTYFLAKGRFLNGIAPLMLSPALGGMAAAAVVRYRAGGAKGGLPVCVLLTAACAVACVLCLIGGLVALAANLGV